MSPVPEFPPRLSRRARIAVAVVALLTFLYSFVIAAQILLWFVLVGIAVGLYLSYLLIVAVFRLVEAVERIATAAEVDSGIRDASDVTPATEPTGGDSRTGAESRDATHAGDADGSADADWGDAGDAEASGGDDPQ